MVRRKPVAVAKAMAGATLRFEAEDLFSDLDPVTAAHHTGRIGRESPWAQYPMLLPERRGRIACPLLVMGAEDDALVAASDVQRCADEWDAPVIWVPGGHDVMLDAHWHLALDQILDWVDEVCPPGSPSLPGAAGKSPLSELLG